VTSKDLASLGQNAHAYAKAYVSLKAALIAEGVTEEEARAEAAHAAQLAASVQYEDGPRCPLCNGSGQA
jgi:hypothetical protein